jgi:beta-galactosidase
MVPGSMHRLKFKVSGSAGIAGICNGDPTSLESMQGDTLPAFNGLCQVILRGIPGIPVPAALSVEAEGLPTVRLTITARYTAAHQDLGDFGGMRRRGLQPLSLPLRRIIPRQ